ncbi:MAG: 30S ribosomal protein S20 [Candidatus Parcubacteria bacterium]|nr:MAG: 30S ribosomal protein S20 [Candidatus Parcubacteria bacterium]
MPKTKSAKKELRKNIKRRIKNLRKKRSIKETTKKFLIALEKKNKEEALQLLKLASKYLDKAAKSFIHKNKAARIKSRLSKKFNKVFLGENIN